MTEYFCDGLKPKIYFNLLGNQATNLESDGKATIQNDYFGEASHTRRSLGMM